MYLKRNIINMQRSFSRQFHISVRNSIQSSKPLSNSTPLKGCSVGTILIRSPILTRQPSEFEKSIYKYNAELWNELSDPLPAEFYFKKGSVGEKDWQERQKTLKGKESPFETIFGKERKEMESNKLLDSATHLQSRVTEADTKNDERSTLRSLDKSLYLLVKKSKSSGWQFPNTPVTSSEKALHLLCQDLLKNILDENSLTWLVARHPLALLKTEQEKTFLLRARLLNGLDVPNLQNVYDWVWCTYDELKNKLSPSSWDSVKNILSDRL
ncbi:mitochondrial ribosomal protein subunit L46 [Schizosaccharomyces pombe]|uniref:Large ribosomal subunit protein mL46 n=1 Tax=Schizosaccharomyces pombe (strain 972 / ATCC 24843) TaxID=284812 RepID=RM17_SCHPO|nr:putative mitochondrial ribosomal protein subunit L17 [Schizosaccharomyces pombe]O94398.1 RecName: Full=Large ribosomal subunit protein mL46; AltName: Full=54S ribosomal protein L17, mitochondrial; Flags: Precursor [Schizosaccharomyces pombe 972h-]CAA22474.1 mitochondrial ribosomal protein subunit L17 (predicted) [Schizosaccharomyces pombe]|eukprot:NP_588448.1 putative mitochondrial ribosomal protein subunit L17 [Schizosaccharomyces pombe]